MTNDKLVPVNISLKPHDAIKLIDQSREARNEVQKLLIMYQDKKKFNDDILLLFNNNEYINLLSSFIVMNIKAGGCIPYHCFVILISELILIDYARLKELCARFEGDSLSRMSTDLKNILYSYALYFDINTINNKEISSQEINLFYDTCVHLKEEKLAKNVINKYNYNKKKSFKLQKRLSSKSEESEIFESFKTELWEGNYNIIALTALYTWSISLFLRLGEVDSAIEIEKFIKPSFDKICKIKHLKSILFQEKANDLYLTDGITDEVYNFYIKAINLSYSADILTDISNCLIEDFRQDIFNMFRPEGKLFHLLDLSGRIIIATNLSADETINELEPLVPSAVKEQDSIIVKILAEAYYRKGQFEKAKKFINEMKKNNWDFEKSRKNDYVLLAQFYLAYKCKYFNEAIQYGEELAKVYKRNRVTFMSYLCFDLADAYAETEDYKRAKKWCIKGLSYNAQDAKLNELYNKIKENV